MEIIKGKCYTCKGGNSVKKCLVIGSLLQKKKKEFAFKEQIISF